jgi:hypothetical protein
MTPVPVLPRYSQNVKRPRRYSKTKAVKELARERLGAPKPARVFEDKSLRPKPKHKKKITSEEEGS